MNPVTIHGIDINGYHGPERRAAPMVDHTPDDCPKLPVIQTSMEEINCRLDDGHARMLSIETTVIALKTSLDANTATTEKNAGNIETIMDIVVLGKSLFRLAGYFEKLLKWAMSLAVVGFTAYYIYVHKRPPP